MEEESKMVKLYNPVYGVLFEFDETQPVDPAHVGQWVLNFTSPDRGLTHDEVMQLKTEGKIGTYPDEFYLVDSAISPSEEKGYKVSWSLDRVTRHKQAVQAFQKVNENGPPFPYWDHIAKINKRDKIAVNFVPGPVIDSILTSSRDSAIDQIYRMIIADAASPFRNLKEFKGESLEHARNLVDAVRQAAAQSAFPNNESQEGEKMTCKKEERTSSTVREQISAALANEKAPLLPIEIARKTRLNRHTVRRELQDMRRQGLVTCNEHRYSLQSEAPHTCKTSSPT
jgi:hypothetical protein